MIEVGVPMRLIKDDEPLISVVLPVYNGEKYLVEAVDSILAQSFTNYELIMIDDGSTDGSHRILQEYENRDARIRVITRENRGLVATLNEGINFARGNWIARMDQDDIALPQRFERQLQWLEQSDADICGSWVQRFGTSDRRIVRLCQSDEVIKTELMFSAPFAHPSVMMRTSLLRRLYYDAACEKAEDYDLWVRAAEAGWKMTNVPEVLLLYRIHSEQISTRAASHQRRVGHEIRIRYWEFMISSTQLTRLQIDEVLKMFDSLSSDVDMDVVDASFLAWLLRSQGESKDVIFDHMTRLYLKMAAGGCSDIVSRWGRLNRKFRHGRGFGTRLRFYMFGMLRIRSDGALFTLLHRIYVWKSSL